MKRKFLFIGLTCLGALILGISASALQQHWDNRVPNIHDTTPVGTTISQIPPHVLSLSDIDLNQLYTLVNKDRTNAGIASLKLNPSLNASAKAKCDDMVAKNYWAHQAPDGMVPSQFITAQGIPYIHLGENLAVGFDNSKLTNDAWMASPEHKRNILDSGYTDVGYAVCQANNSDVANGLTPLKLIVVQHFAEL